MTEHMLFEIPYSPKPKFAVGLDLEVPESSMRFVLALESRTKDAESAASDVAARLGVSMHDRRGGRSPISADRSGAA